MGSELELELESCSRPFFHGSGSTTLNERLETMGAVRQERDTGDRRRDMINGKEDGRQETGTGDGRQDN